MFIINKSVINRLLKFFEVMHIPSKEERVVYLTFDDGPEEGITGFVIDELDKFGFKATFFCRGDNAERNPKLISLLLKKGHSIGNHTYSHLHAYKVSTKEYLTDVEQADNILYTHLFRPPHACLTIQTWLKLRRHYHIIYWAINSGDSNLSKFDYNFSINKLKKNTRNGDVILFHFSHRHENETRALLPEYLKWLKENGYKGIAIKL